VIVTVSDAVYTRASAPREASLRIIQVQRCIRKARSKSKKMLEHTLRVQATSTAPVQLPNIINAFKFAKQDVLLFRVDGDMVALEDSRKECIEYITTEDGKLPGGAI
jgi:hypothetical protein